MQIDVLKAITAFGSAVTAGNLLVVEFDDESSISGIAINDTVGTSYSQAAIVTGTNNMVVYIGIAPSSGANTVTISGISFSYARIAVAEFTHVTTTIDASSTVYSNSSPTTLSVTTTVTNDLLLSLVAAYHSNVTFGWPTGAAAATGATGWIPEQSTGSDANGMAYGRSYFVGSYSVSVTATAADNQPNAVIALRTSLVPVSGVDGQIYYDTSQFPYQTYVYHSSLWVPYT